mmetsp:Transcript_89515/g.161454  ORF Transcript_89515/g.161454 Transcript_89515/m.161454 type:complete len:228 (-) Transcript_89515:350-1033(-)
MTRSMRPAYLASIAMFRSWSTKPMEDSSRSLSSWPDDGSAAASGGGDGEASLVAESSCRTSLMAVTAASFGAMPLAMSSRNLAATTSLSRAGAATACEALGAGATGTSWGAAAAGADGAAGHDSKASPCVVNARSVSKFTTRSSRPLYLSKSSTASIQSSKPIPASSFNWAAKRLEAAAAFGGGMPRATSRSKTATSSAPRISASSGSFAAASLGDSWPKSRRSRIS